MRAVQSRNGNPFRGFADLTTWIAEHVPVESAVLDGEIACIDEAKGGSDFTSASPHLAASPPH
jgi:ATP-dependent DNA ligase